MSDTTGTGKFILDEGAVRSCCGLCENNQSHVLKCMHHVGLESERSGGVLVVEKVVQGRAGPWSNPLHLHALGHFPSAEP